MKRTYSALTLALVLSLLTVACEQVIDIDLPAHEPVLVVNCLFAPDSVWQANVTLSQDIQVVDPPKTVTNAMVVIKNDGVVVDTLTHVSDGNYTSPSGRAPVAGIDYTIHVSAPGYAEVVGNDHAPSTVVPYAMEWRDSTTITEFGDRLGEFSFKIDDPGTQENFYLLKIYAVDSFFQFYPVNFEVRDPTMTYVGDLQGAIMDDATFNGVTRQLKVLIPSDQKARSLMMFFGLSSASEDCYYFLQSSAAYNDANGNPFAEPVRIYSNMTSGMGIFAGFSSALDLVP